MAITETGAIFKALTFDGVSSRDYGVYITGEAVFNAPERDVEMITIPNRNGAFALDNGRFENITVSYPAGIFADTETDFAQAISDFRNILCSKRGYCRLEDEYNPDEYRMAIYKSGLEVSPAQLKAGEFEIIFECKPQRWLKSGDETTELATAHDDYEQVGQSIEITESGLLGTTYCLVKYGAVQSGSGTPSPTNVRPINYAGTFHVYTSPTLDPADGETYEYTVNTYIGTIDMLTGKTVWNGVSKDMSTFTWEKSANEPHGFYADLSDKYRMGDDVIMLCSCYAFDGAARDEGSGTVYYGTDKTFRYYVRETTTAGARIYIRDDDYSTAETFAASLTGSQLVYERSYGTVSTQKPPYDVLPAFTAPMNVWTDGIYVDIKYGEKFYDITNPTLYSSSPLIGVYGYGTIAFDYGEIEIENATLGTVLLADTTSKVSSGASKSFGTASLNVGDTIASEGITVVSIYNCYFNVTSCTVSDTNSNYTTTYKISGATVTFTTKYKPFSFTKASSYPDDVNRINFSLVGSSNTLTSYIDMKVWGGYNGNSMGYVALIRYNYSSNFDFGAITFNQIKGISSQPILGNPTYVDCDIGEAYKIENDQYVSLNQYIDLGSDLPTLKSGTITFNVDSTIKGIEVTPRWWKV